MKRPEGQEDPDSLGELTERYCHEVREGHSPSIEDYAVQHPEHAAEIRELFPAFELLEQSGKGFFDRVESDDWSTNLHRLVEISRELGEGELTPEIIERLAQRGETFDRYELKARIARGGQGAIMRVWDEDLHRYLAMKVVLGKAERSGDTPYVDSKTVGRFLDEAQVTAQLDHPGIVPVHELGLDDHGRVYFTMKLVRGRDLKTVFGLLRDGEEGWTRTRALSVLLKVCEAMAYAHAKDVIHRDLKPANVMVGKYGEVYVMDWGLARVLGEEDRKDIRIQADGSLDIHSARHHGQDVDSSLITMDGDVVGTPAYMAPEQARGELDAIGPHSDVYAVGAMLYHLLAGQMPYVPPGIRMRNHDIWVLLQEGPPTPVHELARDAPAELVAICEKAMARKVSERYRDVVELAEELRAYLEHRVVRAYRTGPWIELQKWVQRNRKFALASAAAVLVVVGSLVFFLWYRAHKEQERRLEADGYLLAHLIDREPDLSFDPARLAEVDDWLTKANDLFGRRPEHEARLAALDAGSDLESGRREELMAGLQLLTDPVDGLVQRVESLRAETAALPERSVTGEDVRRAWSEAIASIADPDDCPEYDGLVIAPQVGLVPLGRSPWSGLWEFWHVASGERPELEDEALGTYRITPADGIVLVLLPGGEFSMGSPEDEPGRNTSTKPEDLHRVVLKPFFLAKYEVTQAQWERVLGYNPSKFKPGERFEVEHSPIHPVERLTWPEAKRFAHRMALCLPTESQWEYAVRAGLQTAFPEGDDCLSTEGFENVGDLAVQPWRPVGTPVAPWNDGFPYTAPVGSFTPNLFGLHDMNGNVAEWCDGTLDPYPGDSDVPTDGRIFTEGSDTRVWRGGFWHSHPNLFRSAERYEDRTLGTNESRGLRVARGLDA